ncbi:hypothetical protein [Marinobacter gelidimuriae]|uniref:hypothetical protein n=1 Tax=Marinobacter gelidimuriae TaxID=2739064 RepID=UPI00039E7A58|nr:hypothetical protein [Marinobacter gelidimuriae]
MKQRHLLLPIGLILTLTACGNTAQFSVAEGTGPDPALPSPSESLVPTVNIAKAAGWRLYVFHYDPLEKGEPGDIPTDDVKQAMHLAPNSWALGR